MAIFETLSAVPVSFWAVIALLIGGGFWALGRLNDGTGLPLLAVLGTAGVWYVGDAFYNDYANTYAQTFSAGTLANAWWQVAWFLAVLLAATPIIHRTLNRQYLKRRSGVLVMLGRGVNQPELQQSLTVLFRGCAMLWVILTVIAVAILKANVIFYIFPFLGFHASPWSHGQVGAGFDFFSILAVYLQLLVASMFGVVAALATNRRLRSEAMLLCLLSWPYFIFDRTRNSILAIVIPAVLSWVFLRLRGSLWKKGVVLVACFLVVNTWMKFIIANRSHTSITAAFKEKGFNLGADKKVHNEGLNMFEELCWVSTFLDNGSYQINWGARYFAEVVNPIPRVLWHNKPLIGLDYAIARGHHVTGPNGTVDTTISTGFIGQGVVNFGRVLGPMAAAILMSLWVAILARLDLNIQALGRLPLYSLGLILTFNLGRDITLITLYPFVFGALVVWAAEKYRPELAAARGQMRVTEPAAIAMNDFGPVQPRGAVAKRLFWRAGALPQTSGRSFLMKRAGGPRSH